MNTYEITFTRENGTTGTNRFTAANEKQARKDFREVYRHGNGAITSVTLVSENVPASKQQEREALDQIRAIVDALGPDSYLATAFSGCFELAEENIENDFALSMKDRAESAKREADELREKLAESEKDYEAARAAAREIAKEKDAELTALKAEMGAARGGRRPSFYQRKETTTMEKLTLSNPITINGKKVKTVSVGGIFTNDMTAEGFYYRELGLYAEDPDPDVGEVLYCYGNCGDLAEWIPPTGGATIVGKTIDIVTAIGSATNVTAYIPADAYATKEDYENYKAIALAAQATANSALAYAQQAVTIAQQAAAAVVELSNTVAQNTSKITTLWDAVFGDITTNPFQITFADLSGITLVTGVWNASLQRLEC